MPRKLLSIFLSLCLLPFPQAKAEQLVMPPPGTMVGLSASHEAPMLRGIKVNAHDPFHFEFILDKGVAGTGPAAAGSVSSSRHPSPRGVAGDEAIGPLTLRSKQIPASSPVSPAFSENELKTEANKLIKYFLASLTVPEKDLWVNLSPYEKDRIVPDAFGQTEMGRDLLAQDYLLKQLTASLVYPEGDIGKQFWKKVYEQVASVAGTPSTEPSMLPSRHPSPGGVAEGKRTFPLAAAATQPASAAGVGRQGMRVDMQMFNKVWIVPDKAVVYENARAGTAYVVESSLKVLTEHDYLAQGKNAAAGGAEAVHFARSARGSMASSPATPRGDGWREDERNSSATGPAGAIRDIVIPQLTKEVNEGANFTQLRQVYNALILAAWYKKKVKDSILAQVYSDKNKIMGTEYLHTIIADVSQVTSFKSPGKKMDDVNRIYQRYLQAFKKGAYNYIKEETDPVNHKLIPRKYFSGGVQLYTVQYTSTEVMPGKHHLAWRC